MKLKFILYLALILGSGIWLALALHQTFTGWQTDPEPNKDRPVVIRNTQYKATFAKQLKTPWTNTSIVLYRSSGDFVSLAAKTAVYTCWSTTNPTNHHKGFDIPVTAFIDPATRKVWLGGVNQGPTETNEYYDGTTVQTYYLVHTNFFIETSAGIFRGDTEVYDSTFSWGESLVNQAQPGETVDTIIDHWEKAHEHDNSWPFYAAMWTTGFIDYFPEGFGSSDNLGTQTIPIRQITVAHGKLRLDFNSLKYEALGSVWLDLSTLEVRHAVEHRPVQFTGKTLGSGTASALAAILTAIWAGFMLRKKCRAVHYILGGLVLAIEAWALIMLCRFYLLGTASPYLSLRHQVYRLDDQWLAVLPVIVISLGFLIAVRQAALLRKYKRP